MMLIMGVLTIASFLMIMGNILSDIIVAFVDPRVKISVVWYEVLDWSQSWFLRRSSVCWLN